MGIDLLDLTFRIEKSFGIRMPVDDWTEIAGTTGDKDGRGFDVTVGQLYDCILSRLSESPDGYRPPRVSRDALFERLSQFSGMPAGDLDMHTELERLLGPADRRAKWLELSRILQTRLPSLRRPFWLTASIVVRVGGVLTIGLVLTRQWNSVSGVLVAMLASGVVWLVALGLTAADATVIPRQCRTVFGLYGLLNRTPEQLHIDEPAPWSSEDVWDMLQAILVECLGVGPKEVTPQARLIGDLGAS